MGGIAVINLGNKIDRNAATIADYTNLYHSLGGTQGRQNLTSRYMTINGAGETVGYSDQLGTLFTPETVAGHIKSGDVWIEYCGSPFWYQASSDGTVTTLGQTGWHEFTEFLGYGWLRDQSFYYPTEYQVSNQYPFRRGFPLGQSLDGVCYPTGKYTQPGGFLGIGGGTYPVAADGFTAMAALHPKGGGYFFYGTYRYSAGQIAASAQVGIPTGVYAQFIQNVLQGNVSAYQCKPYTIVVQSTRHVSAGPTAPVRIQTAHTSTPHSSAHTAHATASAATSANTTKLAEEVLAGTMIVGGLGLGGVWLARRRRRF